jgi:hypothetical protein
MLHCTPRPGELSDQNPWEMEMYRILESWERSREREAQSTGIAAVLAGIFKPR